MKLISLNIWEGELYQPLIDFLDKYSPETDIFCFQEVFRTEAGIRRMNPDKLMTFKSLADKLEGFNGYFEDYVATGEYRKEELAVFVNKINYHKILCGDLELWPDTEIIKILEEGMVNLIKKFNIYSTRSNFFKYENKFADYILVSPDIKVHDFKVLKA